MTSHPQTPVIRVDPVDDRPMSSTRCEGASSPLTWEDASFSTIHTPYYSYS